MSDEGNQSLALITRGALERCKRWARERWLWLAFLVALCVVGALRAGNQGLLAWLLLHSGDARFDRSLTVLLLGVPFGQLLVSAARDVAAHVSGVVRIDRPENQRPQRLLGILETVAYALAFAFVDAKDVATAIGVWMAFKNFGNWSRATAAQTLGLGSKTRKLDLEHGPHAQTDDKDEPRRRLYIFLFANVLQAGFGRALGWTIRWWALAAPAISASLPVAKGEIASIGLKDIVAWVLGAVGLAFSIGLGLDARKRSMAAERRADEAHRLAKEEDRRSKRAAPVTPGEERG